MKNEESIELAKPIQSIIKAIKNTQAIQETINDEGRDDINSFYCQEPMQMELHKMRERLEASGGVSGIEKLSSKPKRKAHQEA